MDRVGLKLLFFRYVTHEYTTYDVGHKDFKNGCIHIGMHSHYIINWLSR